MNILLEFKLKKPFEIISDDSKSVVKEKKLMIEMLSILFGWELTDLDVLASIECFVGVVDVRWLHILNVSQY